MWCQITNIINIFYQRFPIKLLPMTIDREQNNIQIWWYMIHFYHNLSDNYYKSYIKQTKENVCQIWHQPAVCLLTLDRLIYMANEEEWCAETHWTQHKKEPIADASHVPKEEWRLHETWHVRTGMIVVQAIAINEETCRSST